jgi:PAS domain S-box-containing protein
MTAATPSAVGSAELQLLDKSPTPTALVDHETLRFLAVNEAALRLFGYSREEFLGLTLRDTRHPDEDHGQYVSGGPVLYARHGGMRRHLKRSGEVFIADVVVQDIVFDGRRASLVLILDRTERARTQTVVRERERLFSALVEHAPDVIARIDRDLRHIYVNPAIAAATGIAPEQLIGKTNQQLGVPLELCVRWAAGVRRVFATGREQDIEITYSTDAGPRYYESRMVPERGPDGEVESVLAIARDITDRKQSELALRASESRLRQSQREFEMLADALPEVITRFDRELRHTYANAAVESQMGLPRTALLGRTNGQAGFPRDLAESWDDALRMVFETGRALTVEYEYASPGGPKRFEARYIPLAGHGGAIESVLCVAHDFTARQRSEDERLASVTRQRDAFLREVHHRVKNNLQGVIGLLRQHASGHAGLAPFLDKAISQLQAMAAVHDLQGRELRDGVTLDGMVREIAKSVERATGVQIAYDGKGRDNEMSQLRESDAVAVALVLNEIIMNAAKHGAAQSAKPSVSVTSRINAKRAEIAIVNRGTLPRGFDFARGGALGTGLDLVKALLPMDGAAVSFSGNDGYVRAVIELYSPLLAAAGQEREEDKRNEWDRRRRAYSDRRR